MSFRIGPGCCNANAHEVRLPQVERWEHIRQGERLCCMSVQGLLFLALVRLLFVGCSESDQPTATETEGERQAVQPEHVGEVSQVARTTSRVEAEAAQPGLPECGPEQGRGIVLAGGGG